MTSNEGVIIIGAGLSGLILAQGLKTNGINFHIYEKRSDGSGKEGHRFRVTTSTINELKKMLSPDLNCEFDRRINERNGLKPRYLDAHTIDFTEPVVENDHATIPIDRTWIVSLLKKGLESDIAYGKQYSRYENRGERVEVHFADGSFTSGDFLIGADGVHSRVRRQLQPKRKLLDLEKTSISNEDVFTWLMLQDDKTNTQCVLEPIIWKEGSSTALLDYIYFALCRDAAPGSARMAKEEDRTSICKRHLLDAFHYWHPIWKLLLSKTNLEYTQCAQVLSSKPDLEMQTISPNEGRILIVGDAAHPMSPMGGSGATTAVKTTLDLVSLFVNGIVDMQSVQEYRNRMQETAGASIQHSFHGGQKYWRGKEWSEYTQANETIL